MIDDNALDSALSASRPLVAHETTCEACAQSSARGIRWPRWGAAAGAAGVAVLALGAGAAATVGLPFVADSAHSAPVEYDQTVSNGHRCHVSVEFTTETVTAPRTTGRNPKFRTEQLTPPDPEVESAAREILASLDIEALDLSEALIEYDESLGTWATAWDKSPDARESNALHEAIMDEVEAGLRAQGLWGGPLGSAFSTDCDDQDGATP